MFKVFNRSFYELKIHLQIDRVEQLLESFDKYKYKSPLLIWL